MTMAFGLEARVPFLDIAMVRLGLGIPPEFKRRGESEKWILRTAFEGDLPKITVWRSKQKFARGCGSAELLRQIAEGEIGDAEFEREKQVSESHQCSSKEELYFYRIFHSFFPQDGLARLVGRSHSL